MSVIHDRYLRREWKIEKRTHRPGKDNYVPSHERPGFQEDKVQKLPCLLDREKEA